MMSALLCCARHRLATRESRRCAKLGAMEFATPLLSARLVRRYKRFLADVEREGRIETVHCANPGSMMGLAPPGAPVWLSKSTKPGRKLPLTWELVEVE